MTVSSTSVETKSFRIFNASSKKSFWLTAQDDGGMVASEVNSDPAHAPVLLVDPVSTPSPAIFTTEVPTQTTFQFDGVLGVGSGVSLTDGSAGTISSVSLSGSMMIFQYTAAASDKLKFTVKSADLSKTARRLFSPATFTPGPSYVSGSLTQTLFTHGWSASATASFSRSLGSLSAEIVNDAGAVAGTVTKAITGSSVSLTNIVVQPGASFLRFTAVTDTNGNATIEILVPITTQAATKPTLVSVSTSAFTIGVPTVINVSFNEALQSFVPSASGTGASVTTTWTPGLSTAQCTVTARADSTQLTFSVVDSNDGGADVITHGISVAAPVQPALSSLSVSLFSRDLLATGVVATFDRQLASIGSITVSSGGTVTVTGAFPSNTVTFNLKATAAANPGYLFFNDVVSTQNSAPVTRSSSITVTAPFVPVPTAGLVSWWDFSEAFRVTLNGSNFIQAVVDRFGAFNMSSTVPSASLLSGQAAGGLTYYSEPSTATFNEVTSLKSLGDTTTYATSTYFFAFRPLNTSTFNSAIAFAVPGYNDVSGRFFYSSGNIYGNAQAGGGPAGHPVTTDRWYVASLEITNGGLNLRSRVWNHPTDATYHTGVGSTSYPMKHLSLGRQTSIGEVLLYDSVLSDANAQLAADYLAARWRLDTSGVFSLNANTDTHFTLSGSTVQAFANPGVTSSTITGGTLSRNTLSSGKKYIIMDGVTSQLAVSGPAFNQSFTLWMFGFWTVAPPATGFSYPFSAVNATLVNRGVMVLSQSAQIRGPNNWNTNQTTYTALETYKWYLIAMVSYGTNNTDLYIDGTRVHYTDWYPDGSVTQITLNNYATNTTGGFNSNMRVGAVGLTREALSQSALVTLKSDLLTEFGAITGTLPFPVAPAGATWHLTPDASTVTVDATGKLLNMKNLITGVDSIYSPGQLDANVIGGITSMIWDASSGTLRKSENYQSFYIKPSLVNSDWTIIQCYYYISKITGLQLFAINSTPPGGVRNPNHLTKVSANSYRFNTNVICDGPDPSQNAWHVSVTTYNVATQGLGIYLDGAYVGGNSTPLVGTSGADMTYCNFYQYGYSTICRVGTIMIVPRAISQAEVSAVTDSCLAYWTRKVF